MVLYYTHERHSVSKSQLFVQQFVKASNTLNLNAPYYWPFVRENYREPADFPHKGPVMQKAFPMSETILFLSVIMIARCQRMQHPLRFLRCVSESIIKNRLRGDASIIYKKTLRGYGQSLAAVWHISSAIIVDITLYIIYSKHNKNFKKI